MKIKKILSLLQEASVSGTSDDHELIVGSKENEVSGILICHDAVETVIEEAITKKCNLIISIQPLIVKKLKKLTGESYIEHAVVKAIKNDITVYAACSPLRDFKNNTKMLCDKLNLKNAKVLIPMLKSMHKLVTCTVPENAPKLRKALFDAGAGKIGNYDNCSFNTHGIGTYIGNERSNPQTGERLEFVEAREIKIEVFFEKSLQNKVLEALFSNHVYEEIAYEICSLENTRQNNGLGVIGTLEKPMLEKDFLSFVKEKMSSGGIRHSTLGKNISVVAFLAGSGSYGIENAIQAGADIFITADLNYQDYYKAENKIVLVDVGYFESKEYEKNAIIDFLRQNIPDFEQKLISSEVDTNLVKHL